MKKIIFVTSNIRKVEEAKLACQKFNIDVQQIKVDIEEIQSDDAKLISVRKAESAYLIVQKPLVVADTYWNIPGLNGFPGGYMKDVANWFKPEDFLSLMKDKSDKRISFTESITYKDSSQIKSFSKTFWGEFVDEPKGTGNSIENVAKFQGPTLGELREQGGLSHKAEDYIWVDFAKWYSEK